MGSGGGDAIIWFLLIAGGSIAWYLYARTPRGQRVEYIEGFDFPDMVLEKFRKAHPQLNDVQVTMVMHGLRDYFEICRRAGDRLAAMPSRIADDLWHELILFTRTYEAFCKAAFGRFLHHTPAEAMRSPVDAQEGIRRSWRLACALEGINPRQPHRLPRLFALDAALEIPDGFLYSLDCTRAAATADNGRRTADFCASHIGCASCAGSMSTGLSGEGALDGADDVGGCGGSTCGGGCGGD